MRNDRVDRRSNDRRVEPYPTGNRPNNSRYNGHEDRRMYDQNPPRTGRSRNPIPEYNLSIEPVDLVAVMKEMGRTVKWPRKMNAPPEHRDARFRYEFHGDHGHRTEDCATLKLEVAELLKRGHLLEYLTNKL
ncbi:hypothetical protein Dsin_024445 [Dipteronia sinensis]|uniref:Uncharacterized protein n=1 Tax=Dipteronia sinensis TaxID=43782 RepID=A0AAD9ZU11_9ROSI|nr:hypothetical protein Dsin_024445 [Dipteronia sinensis]